MTGPIFLWMSEAIFMCVKCNRRRVNETEFYCEHCKKTEEEDKS